jgi:hypothetical protein
MDSEGMKRGSAISLRVGQASGWGWHEWADGEWRAGRTGGGKHLGSSCLARALAASSKTRGHCWRARAAHHRMP